MYCRGRILVVGAGTGLLELMQQGLREIWINRTNCDIPEGIEAIGNLVEYSESHVAK